MDKYHTSVLLPETIALLRVEKGKRYIDGTLGGGGHTEAILNHGGIVLGIDADKDALDYVSEKFKIQNSKFKIGKDLYVARGNFRDIDRLAKEFGFEEVAGVLLDIGVSAHHLEKKERGFSIQQNGPLDMRMDTRLSVTAEDLVNGLHKSELTELLAKLGEEPFAKRIAKQIVRNRERKKITSTNELATIIAAAVPGRSTVHPATKTFQALRIAINDELHSLEEALPKSFALLAGGGRLAVITFHSLEDRIVKETFQRLVNEEKGRILTEKPVVASEKEIQSNRRSRSAKLRVIERIV